MAIEPLIKNCSCGEDHMEMPHDFESVCGDSELTPCTTPDCKHAQFRVDLVCIKHKRHEPCRTCLSEELI